jgi:DNA-binding protein Fis
VLRAALLAPGNTIQADDIVLGRNATRPRPAHDDGAAPLGELIARRVSDHFDELGDSEPQDLYGWMIAEIERPLIELTLERAGGNQVRAARMLGLNRNTLRKKITELKIVLRKNPPE